jgi:hypothetical protein
LQPEGTAKCRTRGYASYFDFGNDPIGLAEIDLQNLKLAIDQYLAEAFAAERMTVSRVGEWITLSQKHTAAVCDRLEHDAGRWIADTVLNVIIGDPRRNDWFASIESAQRPDLILTAEASQRHIAAIVGDGDAAALDRLARALKRAAKVKRGRKPKDAVDSDKSHGFVLCSRTYTSLRESLLGATGLRQMIVSGMTSPTLKVFRWLSEKS